MPELLAVQVDRVVRQETRLGEWRFVVWRASRACQSGFEAALGYFVMLCYQ